MKVTAILAAAGLLLALSSAAYAECAGVKHTASAPSTGTSDTAQTPAPQPETNTGG